MASPWKCKVREYAMEKEDYKSRLENSMNSHPLLNNPSSSSNIPKSKNSDQSQLIFSLPGKSDERKMTQSILNEAASLTSDDPLLDPLSALSSMENSFIPGLNDQSRLQTASTSQDSEGFIHGKLTHEDINRLWKSRKNSILGKYTTSKKISVVESPDDEEKAIRRDSVEQMSTKQDDKSKTVELFQTQEEFEKLMQHYKKKLFSHWSQGERVGALKTAIQCSKFISGSTVAWFFPTKYVHGIDLLDDLGEFVYKRLKEKGIDDPERVVVDDFRTTEVHPESKETAKNWIYKVSCIRELIPRIFVELSIISAFRMVESSGYLFNVSSTCSRIVHSIRGIGDPVVAIFARSYACTQISRLLSSRHKSTISEDVFQTALDDCLADIDRILSKRLSTIMNLLSVKLESKHEFLEIISPALSWIMFLYANNVKTDRLQIFFDSLKSTPRHAIILSHMLESFPASFFQKRAVETCDLVINAFSDNYDLYKLYKTYGHALIASLPPSSERMSIFNKLWRSVSKLSDPQHYIEVAVVFVQYILDSFSSRELDIFVGDIIKHVKPMQAYNGLQTQLSSIFQSIIQQIRISLRDLFQMDNILPFLDLIVDKPLKKTACKALLQRFKLKPFTISDSVLTHSLLDVGKSLHDSVDSLSMHSEKNELIDLFACIHKYIDFGNDLEQHLSVLGEFRKSFPNLDEINKLLIHSVNKLAMRAHQKVSGRHSKRTAAFVKACMAFCHITIPSLDDSFDRIRFFLSSAQVALLNGVVGQAEGLVNGAINGLSSLPDNVNEEALAQFIDNLLSFLLIFPGSPESGPFMLFNTLLNAIDHDIARWTDPTEHKSRVFLNMLSLFGGYSQNKFLHSISGVDSNDLLYGGMQSYNDELNRTISLLIDSILGHLQYYGEQQREGFNYDAIQSKVSLEFVNVLINVLEMEQASAVLVVKLLRLASKSPAVDTGYLKRTVLHISNKKGQWYRMIADKISK